MQRLREMKLTGTTPGQRLKSYRLIYALWRTEETRATGSKTAVKSTSTCTSACGGVSSKGSKGIGRLGAARAWYKAVHGRGKKAIHHLTNPDSRNMFAELAFLKIQLRRQHTRQAEATHCYTS